MKLLNDHTFLFFPTSAKRALEAIGQKAIADQIFNPARISSSQQTSSVDKDEVVDSDDDATAMIPQFREPAPLSLLQLLRNRAADIKPLAMNEATEGVSATWRDKMKKSLETFFAARNNEASTSEILNEFKERVGANEKEEFRFLLKAISDFDSSNKIWKLRKHEVQTPYFDTDD